MGSDGSYLPLAPLSDRELSPQVMQIMEAKFPGKINTPKAPQTRVSNQAVETGLAAYAMLSHFDADKDGHVGDEELDLKLTGDGDIESAISKMHASISELRQMLHESAQDIPTPSGRGNAQRRAGRVRKDDTRCVAWYKTHTGDRRTLKNFWPEPVKMLLHPRCRSQPVQFKDIVAEVRYVLSL